MTLFQDQPDLLLGFKEFLPEAQGLLNQLVPVTSFKPRERKREKESERGPVCVVFF